MCLINLNIGTHPKYKMIIAANRDESYERPTETIHWWEDDPNIFGGRDLKAKGTWLAVSKSGKIGALTNIRNSSEMTKVAEKSRGELIVNYLQDNKTPREYLESLKASTDDYAGYNLLVGDTDDLYYMNNYQDEIERLEHTTHGLSNAFLNSAWPKVTVGKETLDSIIKNDDVDIEALFSLLRMADPAPDELVQETGVDFTLEKQLSSLFINLPDMGYGTRCSSVVLVDRDNRITFIERTFYKGQKTGENREEIIVKN